MSVRLKFLLFVPLFIILSSSVMAEDNNYFNHKKYFFLCSYKRECSFCESCNKEFYKVKIQNNLDKRIKSVTYKYYSSQKSKVFTREAVIEGGQVDNKQIGILYLCLPSKQHWVISEITYDDNSSVTFLVDGPLRKFIQEPDECDCSAPGNRDY